MLHGKIKIIGGGVHEALKVPLFGQPRLFYSFTLLLFMGLRTYAVGRGGCGWMHN